MNSLVKHQPAPVGLPLASAPHSAVPFFSSFLALVAFKKNQFVELEVHAHPKTGLVAWRDVAKAAEAKYRGLYHAKQANVVKLSRTNNGPYREYPVWVPSVDYHVPLADMTFAGNAPKTAQLRAEIGHVPVEMNGNETGSGKNKRKRGGDKSGDVASPVPPPTPPAPVPTSPPEPTPDKPKKKSKGEQKEKEKAASTAAAPPAAVLKP